MLISINSMCSILENAKSLQEQITNVASNFIPKIQQPLRSIKKRKYNLTCLAKKDSNTEAGQAPLSLVLIETRKSHSRAVQISVEALLRKIDAPLALICGHDNVKDICEIMQSTNCKEYKILLVDEGIKSAIDYNEFLMSFDFWKSIYETGKILVFQSDSSICQKSNYRINDFMDFDYIGGQWKVKRPCGLEVYGGSGGFSLRDRKLSIQALQLFGDVPWQFGEDGFYGFFIDTLGGVVAREEEIDRFCSEKHWKEGCFAIHKLRIKPDDIDLIKSLTIHCPDWLRIQQINH